MLAPRTDSPTFWTDALGRRLLASLSEAARSRLLQSAGGAVDENGCVALLDRARSDPMWQQAVRQAWRDEHWAVIAATEIVSIESSVEQCQRMLSQFGAEEILLELLTDAREDGPELAEWIIANVPCQSARQDLQAAFDEVLSDLPEATNPPSEPVRRVVIFGGHQRDESKMTRRLFGDSVFDVRWKPCEKSQGSPDGKLISQAIEHADAVILVTTMISHNVARLTKQLADQRGVPWLAVPKATHKQLTVALKELFPDVGLAGDSPSGQADQVSGESSAAGS